MDGKPGRTVVVGAGPAGLTCAHVLASAGAPVEVFEASPFVGGLARSFPLFDQIVDVGPHRFFSSIRMVTDHWRRFAGEDYALIDRLTRIHYGGRFFHYPLKPLNVFANLGPVEIARCLAHYGRRQLAPVGDPKSFQDWVTNRFGDRLFQIFFKTYTEKVWGIPCDRIDADWATQRIKKFSLGEAVKSAFFGSGAKHMTLVDQFAYPDKGTGSVYENMARDVERLGGKVHVRAPVREVLFGADRRPTGLLLEDGARVAAEHVVSTMPLTLMVKAIPHAPDDVKAACDRLYYRNTIMVYVEVDAPDVFPDNWIYVHAPEAKHGRITNFANWSPGLRAGSRRSILAMEFWCFDADEIWKASDDELGALAKKELLHLGLVKTPELLLRTHVLRIKRSYPVYETGYRDPLSKIESFVSSVPGLLAIGRYGAFKYNNQDHSILMGLLAAKEILERAPQGLWSVNTDSEYQEEAAVSRVGLAK